MEFDGNNLRRKPDFAITISCPDREHLLLGSLCSKSHSREVIFVAERPKKQPSVSFLNCKPRFRVPVCLFCSRKDTIQSMTVAARILTGVVGVVQHCAVCSSDGSDGLASAPVAIVLRSLGLLTFILCLLHARDWAVTKGSETSTISRM